MSTLKLIALDLEDLAALAAHVQDAAGTIGDMAYLPKERRFVALLNRYDWALAADQQHAAGVRRRSALRIERVLSAQVQGIDVSAKGAVISVLTLQFEPATIEEGTPAGAVVLVLAGGGAIRLQVECIEVQVEDLGPSWSAKRQPEHSEPN
jgi:Protein of unknown function (DUF2948)